MPGKLRLKVRGSLVSLVSTRGYVCAMRIFNMKNVVQNRGNQLEQCFRLSWGKNHGCLVPELLILQKILMEISSTVKSIFRDNTRDRQETVQEFSLSFQCLCEVLEMQAKNGYDGDTMVGKKQAFLEWVFLLVYGKHHQNSTVWFQNS